MLKQPFHLAFLLTCICSRNWFFLLCPFILCPPSRPSCLGLLEKVDRAAGSFRIQTCSECRVCQAETRGTAQLWEHLQEEIEQGTGMKLLHSPTQHRLSACKSARLSNRLSVCLYCLYVAKRIVPFLLFTFSHSQPPPLCSPLFVPHWLSLIRLLLKPLRLWMRLSWLLLSWLLWSFVKGDKEGESHKGEDRAWDL